MDNACIAISASLQRKTRKTVSLSPPISSVNPTYIYTNIPTDSYQWEDLGKILQKCGDKVPVYYAEWRPRKNKNIFLMLYFVKDGNNLRAIYGEQLNRLKYMDE